MIFSDLSFGSQTHFIDYFLDTVHRSFILKHGSVCAWKVCVKKHKSIHLFICWSSFKFFKSFYWWLQYNKDLDFYLFIYLFNFTTFFSPLACLISYSIPAVEVIDDIVFHVPTEMFPPKLNSACYRQNIWFPIFWV